MMDTVITFLFMLAGVFLRLALPIAGTAVLIHFLRKLDARWQSEVETQSLPVQKPECWKIKGCTPKQQEQCMARTSASACWQVFRLPNGYLREGCISCKVFTDAPISVLQTSPTLPSLKG
jgi:hypothetical protein